MNTCSGTPAEQHALAYLEGSLPEFEVERFEEHYFDCPACLAQVEALLAVRDELARHPAPQAPTGVRTVFAWPQTRWAVGLAAALLLTGVVALRMVENRPAQPQVATHTPAISKQPAPAPKSSVPADAPVKPSQLADLALPSFVAYSLRGESEDAHFVAGMKAYSLGDCRTAVSTLKSVAGAPSEARAARFYTGACQMRLGDLAAARSSLLTVIKAGDSPQQEAALYTLGQVALAANDLGEAHRYLLHTITLRGDLERKARAEDRKVLALIQQQGQTTAADKEKKSQLP
jgi:hypothetical protein